MLRDISLHILDLTQNSISAGASEIRIDVASDAENERLSVRIEDNGCGMSEAFLASVTDPFTTSRKTRNVGMGIPFFKLACEQGGGRLEIQSQVNVGTALSGDFETAARRSGRDGAVFNLRRSSDEIRTDAAVFQGKLSFRYGGGRKGTGRRSHHGI